MKSVNKNVFNIIILGLILTALLPLSVYSQKVDFRLAKDGLQSLTYGGTEFIERTSLLVSKAVFKNGDGTVINTLSSKELRRSLQPDGRKITMNYAWGQVTCTFHGGQDSLLIDIAVENTSNYILSEFAMELAAMQFPAAPAGWTEHVPYRSFNYGQPTINIAQCGSVTVAACNRQVGRPLQFGWAGRKSTTARPLILATSSDWVADLLNPILYRPIYPAQQDKFEITIRFASGQKSFSQVAPDLVDSFRTMFPFQIDWKDRRPVGAIHLSSSDMKIEKNPRGWFMDRNADFISEKGQKEFRRRLLEHAVKSVAALKKIDAQGMITWDIEGQQYPHAISYLGDPRSLPREMEEAADAYFKVFTQAGLRSGVTLRPQIPVRTAYGQGVNQVETADPFSVLEDKLTYARKRWGCSLFYIDSNGDPGVPFPADIFTRLARKYPDVLLIPEHETPQYYSYTAPYRCYANLGQFGTPENVRALYPEAFAIISVAHKNPSADRDRLVQYVKRGDILLVNAWYIWDGLDSVNEIYRMAGRDR